MFLLEYWSDGVMEYWSIGVLEYWSNGVMGRVGANDDHLLWYQNNHNL